MKQRLSIIISMVLLALILVGAQTHAFMTSAKSDGTHFKGLKASIVETLRYLDGYRDLEYRVDDGGDPAVPGSEGAPDLSIQ